MKKIKHFVVFVLIFAVVLTLFVGCGNESTDNASIADPFIPIAGQEENGLVYHRDSKTVYVLFNYYAPPGYAGYGYLDAYIVNGHYCEYRDGKIYEVVPKYEYLDPEIIEIEPTYIDLDMYNSVQSADDKWNSLTEEEKEALLENK